MIGLKVGDGTCGNCGTRLDCWNLSDSCLLLCTGCGIIIGKGADAAKVISEEVAAGRARTVDAGIGLSAMRMIGGPAA